MQEVGQTYMEEYGQSYYGKPESVFKFEVRTIGGDETFTLPIYNGGTYNFHVVWGDGNEDDITAWDDAAKTHTYTSADTYEMKITGIIVGWRFNSAGDAAKIYDIKSWGPLRLGNSNGYFYGCSNLTISATDILDLTGTTTLNNLFNSCPLITTVPSMNDWDVSSVTVADYMLYSAILFNQDISSWDVSSLENMAAMFQNAQSFNQDISSWDVSSVTTMWRMFYNADAFEQNLGSWDITSVTDMTYMFIYMTLDTVNYDALLTGWEAQAVQNNVPFHGGDSKYSAAPSAAATARQALIDDHSWVITDGGEV